MPGPRPLALAGIFKPVVRDHDVQAAVAVEIADAARGDAAVIVPAPTDLGPLHPGDRIEPGNLLAMIGDDVESPVSVDVGCEDVVAPAFEGMRGPRFVGVLGQPAGVLEPDPVENNVRPAVLIDVQGRRSQCVGEPLRLTDCVPHPHGVRLSFEPIGGLRLAPGQNDVQIAVPVEVQQRKPAGPPGRSRQRVGDREVRPLHFCSAGCCPIGCRQNHDEYGQETCSEMKTPVRHGPTSVSQSKRSHHMSPYHTTSVASEHAFFLRY